ncbi:hypothetical protein MKX01_015343 [Papaver californicum]|nr:hypothetical protein MKX01_015343 [Papaver californicum]
MERDNLTGSAGSTEKYSSISLDAASYRGPIFVHPSDSPNVVLCSPPLNDDNYASWKRRMMRALRVKNRIGFIDGFLSKLIDKSKLDEWMREDDLVTGSIHAAILPSIKDSVSYQLRQQLPSIKQDGSSTMVFYGRLRAIWDEMDAIRPTSTCIYANAKDVLDLLNQDRAMEFLQGLHDRFGSLHSNILQCVEFPPLLTIYNLVRQEELQHFLDNTMHIVESATLAVTHHDGDNSSKANKKRNYYCDYCHRDGYTRDICYKLKG